MFGIFTETGQGEAKCTVHFENDDIAITKNDSAIRSRLKRELLSRVPVSIAEIEQWIPHHAQLVDVTEKFKTSKLSGSELTFRFSSFDTIKVWSREKTPAEIRDWAEENFSWARRVGSDSNRD